MAVLAKPLALFSSASILAINLLIASNASAQTQAVDEATEMGGLIVTGGQTEATGLRLSPKEIPQSISVLDGVRFREQDLTDISQVMEQVVGIQSSSTSSLGTDGVGYIARGFTVKNYQIDGISRPTTLYGFAEETSDLVAYDRVEVVRGSAGLMAGVGQPSAAINMIRKRPGTDFRASAAVSTGSWDRYRVEGDIGGSLAGDGKVRGRLAGAWQQNDSFIDREHVDRHALYGVIGASIGGATELLAGLEYQNFQNEGASRGGVPLYFTDGTLTNFARSTNTGATWSKFERQSTNAFLSLTHSFNSDWRLQIDAEHKEGFYDETIGYFYGTSIDRVTGDGGDLLSTRWASDLNLDALHANLRGSFEAFGQKHQVALTVSHARFRDEGPGYPGWWSGAAYWTPINAYSFFATGDATQPNLDATGERYGNKVETSAIAGVVRLKPTERLSLIAGGRATWWEQAGYYESSAGVGAWTPGAEEKGELTPYAGAVFDITSDISAYASYASIFDPQTARTITGETLDPLEGNTYELGLKGSLLSGRVTASAAVFRMEQDNFAEADGPGIFAPDGSPAYHAISGLESSGFELEVGGEVLPGWRVTGGFANATSKDQSGERQMVEIPRNSLKLFTTYRLNGALEGLTVGGNLRWQSKVQAAGVSSSGDIYVQDSLAVVDLLASYRLSQRATVAVHVDNVFDESYYSSVYSWSSRYGEPRSFSVSLRSTF